MGFQGLSELRCRVCLFDLENLVLWASRRSRFAGVRDRWFCLGVLCLFTHDFFKIE